MDELPILIEFDWAYARMILKSDELIKETATDFYKSIDELKTRLEEMQKEISVPEVMDRYRIDVHALKNTAKMVGAITLSGLSREAELSAIAKNEERIRVLNPILVEELARHKEILSELCQSSVLEEEEYSASQVKELLQEMKSCVETRDVDGMDAVIEKLSAGIYEEGIKAEIELLEQEVLNLDMAAAAHTVEELLGRYGEV